MFIAHLPSGYIMALKFLKRNWARSISSKWIIFVGTIGAVFPDTDMLYFYFIDKGQILHHSYITHWPSFWICLLLVNLAWGRFSPKAIPGIIFSLGGLLHVVLDSFVGDIRWLAPFSDVAFSIYEVPAIYNPWWLNFVLHWTFAVEVVVCVWAFNLFRKRVVTERS
ncbi:MAG: metal-dependent hydrolase [Gammaproteobacteria bacterium]|nr:metal-dependent hydrolase [Gammaproteobacteria bacterium]MDH5727957.1 metal-dependent hydrolase [Gammaproteobacteria bacterium]